METVLKTRQKFEVHVETKWVAGSFRNLIVVATAKSTIAFAHAFAAGYAAEQSETRDDWMQTFEDLDGVSSWRRIDCFGDSSQRQGPPARRGRGTQVLI
jgi:hypothetical protein